jgi:LacI family transcriptional regulator
MNLEDIARLAGVSRSTVSRVVNGDPRVSDAARARVQQVIAEHDFTPNAAARSLASRRTRMVGLIIPRLADTIFRDPWFPPLIDGCTTACADADLSLLIAMENTARTEGANRLVSRLIRGHHLDGVIDSSSYVNDQFIARLVHERFPHVLVGRDEHCRSSFVDIDNRSAARAAVAHLLGHGRTRLAMISGPTIQVAATDRRQGFLDALAEAGLEPVAPVIEIDYSQRQAYDVAIELLELTRRPDAIFAGSDAMAIGVLQAARQLGMSVPDDLAVMGFDDIEPDRTHQLELSTVRQPARELGVRAVELLTDLIADPTKGPLQEWLPTELILRGSCGCGDTRRPLAGAMAETEVTPL